MVSLTAKLSERLKKLGIGKTITLHNGALTMAAQQACYRAAKRAGVRVSVRTFPNKAIVLRLS